MADREKLIELLCQAMILFDERGNEQDINPFAVFADHLIANGVVVREDGCEVCRRHVPPGANYCWKCGRPLR